MSKAYIACDRCKSRKKKCTGETPKCGLCSAQGADCHYAPERKFRGAAKNSGFGKWREQITNASELHSQDPSNPTLLPVDNVPSLFNKTYNISGNYDQSTSEVLPIALHKKPENHNQTWALTTPTGDNTDSSGQLDPQTSHSVSLISNRFVSKLPSFLSPSNYGQQLQSIQKQVQLAQAEDRPTPLFASHISVRLIQNSFSDIYSPEKVIIPLSQLVELFLDVEGGASSDHVSRDPDAKAKWAILNASLALATKAKMAPGDHSASAIGGIAFAYHQNALRVLEDLLLAPPSVWCVRALLMMATATGQLESGMTSPLVLATNAIKMLRVLIHQDTGLYLNNNTSSNRELLKDIDHLYTVARRFTSHRQDTASQMIA
uniref:Zinc finger transcription factor Tkc6 n=1 Tax=Trichoderma koningii TaxID=97093 RepID=M1P1S4_TRIKO|nr:zinc finger transcription factor Tkc6 [Trichoderma koningii]